MARVVQLTVVMVFAAAAAIEAQARETADLLERIGNSVQLFVDNFTNVVAEEEYRQQFRHAAPRRRLKSDFLLVGYPGQEKLFLTFRDVLEVDGRRVGDQQERLTRLFLEPFEDAVRRAAEIQREGARHSLDRGGRLMDPLQVLGYLQAAYQQNFRFTLGGVEPSLGPGVRELDLEQIVEAATQQVALRGKAWVVESSGRVLKTELRAGRAPAVRFTTTTFARDPVLGIDVPLEMQDSVPLARDDEFQGRASYRNFRRFQVRVDEAIDVPPTPR
jgi:hypothetical protein